MDPKWPLIASETLKDLLRGMLHKDKQQRYSLSDIANHPWVTVGPDRDSLLRCRTESTKEYDEGIEARMRRAGIVCIGLRENLADGVDNEQTMVYKMLKRQKPPEIPAIRVKPSATIRRALPASRNRENEPSNAIDSTFGLIAKMATARRPPSVQRKPRKRVAQTSRVLQNLHTFVPSPDRGSESTLK
jgi:serine/threonine protein kinase